MRVPIRKMGNLPNITNDNQITEAKFQELRLRLQKLKESHPRISDEVKRLAELGDFSENAEYQLAKGKLRGLNSRIETLEKQIGRAIIIKPSKNTDCVAVGHNVVVEVNGVKKTYQILGSSETDPAKGLISRHSPLGSALLDHRVNDVVDVNLGGKIVKYKIVSIK